MKKDLIRDGRLDREAASELIRQLLQTLFRTSKLDLTVSVQTAVPSADRTANEPEILVDIKGQDKDLVLARNGEVLLAIEHLVMRALGLEPVYHDKIHVDCGGYRALRIEELKMTSRVAAERVLTSGQPFTLNPMNPRERRIVHVALKDLAGIRTESVGAGEERQVVIHPIKPERPGKK